MQEVGIEHDGLGIGQLLQLEPHAALQSFLVEVDPEVGRHVPGHVLSVVGERVRVRRDAMMLLLLRVLECGSSNMLRRAVRYAMPGRNALASNSMSNAGRIVHGDVVRGFIATGTHATP